MTQDDALLSAVAMAWRDALVEGDHALAEILRRLFDVLQNPRHSDADAEAAWDRVPTTLRERLLRQADDEDRG